jgi:hypothetical protein
MNKTVYLRDEDVPVWEKARELAGDKLSPVIIAALKVFTAEREGTQKGFERIVLEFDDSEDDYLPKKKAFMGRWIIPPQEPYSVTDEKDTQYYGAIAETAKGAFVVFERAETAEESKCKFAVFKTISEGAKEEFNYLFREAIKRRGVPVEELDI